MLEYRIPLSPIRRLRLPFPRLAFAHVLVLSNLLPQVTDPRSKMVTARQEGESAGSTFVVHYRTLDCTPLRIAHPHSKI